MKRIMTILILALCWVTVNGSAAVLEHHLDNGMKVIVKEDHRAPIAVTQVWYKVGSSYEPQGITGVSHVLEHMMFKGTETIGTKDIDRDREIMARLDELRELAARPGVVAIPLEAKTDAEITFLANVITLTPGTLSLDVSEDRSTLYVHTMFLESPEVLRESIKEGFERRVLELLR